MSEDYSISKVPFGAGYSGAWVQMRSNGARPPRRVPPPRAEERYEYTVVGDPVNEAARLTEAAKTVPERVLASGGAVRTAGEEGRCWRPIGVLTLRGRALPTEAYVPPAATTGSEQERSAAGRHATAT